MNKQFVGKSITILVDLVKSRAPDKMDNGTLTKMTRDDVRNMSDQIFIQLPIKFQILENDEPKADTDCELSVDGYDNTGVGTTNDDGIVEWNNHKEVSEMMVLPMSCSLSYEDKTVNINITEESDEGSIIQIENGILKGEDKMIYSLEEQIIGTWIDGRPIYQITKSTGIAKIGIKPSSGSGKNRSASADLTIFAKEHNIDKIILLTSIIDLGHLNKACYNFGNYSNIPYSHAMSNVYNLSFNDIPSGYVINTSPLATPSDILNKIEAIGGITKIVEFNDPSTSTNYSLLENHLLTFSYIKNE